MGFTMFDHHRLKAALLIVCAVAQFAPAASANQEFPDRDTREINAYVLTESGLAKYSQATRNLAGLADNCDDEEGTQSLDAAVARLDANTKARGAITSAGMTTREYLLFSFSLLQNGIIAWTISQPGGKLPAGASTANVNFYRAHEAAIQKLGKETQSDDCDAADSEE